MLIINSFPREQECKCGKPICTYYPLLLKGTIMFKLNPFSQEKKFKKLGQINVSPDSLMLQTLAEF